MPSPYARTVRESLEQHRRAGLPFESAWALTIQRHRPPRGEDEWHPSTLLFAKRAFQRAYDGAERKLGALSVIAEEDAA